MKILYHNDLDGIASAALVSILSLNKYAMSVSDYIPLNYDQPIPFDRLLPGEEVWMVDFTHPDINQMKRLVSDYHFFWIDHHEDLMKKTEEALEKKLPPGIRDSAMAACELVCVFAGKKPKNIHWVIKAIGAKDRGVDFTDCLSVQDICFTGAFFEHKRFHPHDNAWNKILDNQINPLELGGIIYDVRKSQYIFKIETSGIFFFWEGLKVLLLNDMPSSYIAKIARNDFGVDICICFYMTKFRKFKHTIYSDSHNILQIALHFGGGGHPGASGWVSDKIFEKTDLDIFCKSNGSNSHKSSNRTEIVKRSPEQK